MELIKHLFDVVLHIDRYLDFIIRNYGAWRYGILFLVIFCETGLVITPFLPGDSLLFAVGAIAASTGAMEPVSLFVLISLAAILGNTTNYWIGHKIGPAVFDKNSRFLNKEQLHKTHRFYEKHGGLTIIVTRFMPIIRTFAPFVAGVGAMTYAKFFIYNIIGGVLWAGSFIFAGYFFGNIPFIKKNFSIVIFAIIIISVLPAIIEFIKQRRRPPPNDK